jgi:hypothetical protein
MNRKMRIAAGCIALLIAVILLVGAAVDFNADMTNAPENIRQAFADIHDDAALNRDLAETDSRKNSEAVRAAAGAAFLVAGLFILGSHRTKSNA